MKHILLLLFALIVVYPTYAQRAESDNVKLIYRHLPNRPLPLTVKTYSIKLVNNDPSYRFSQQEIDYLKIQGFTEVPENGDIEVYFNLKGFSNNTSTNSKQEKKVVNGKEVINTVYYYKISTFLDCDYKISTGADRSKNVSTYHPSNSVDSELKSFATNAEAENDLKAKSGDIINNNKRSCIYQAIANYKSSNDNNYGYYEATDYFKVYSGKGGKFDYSDLDTAKTTFKNAILLFNDKKFDEYSAKVAFCINVWTKALKEFDPENKKARINKKIAPKLWLNLAYANLYLNKFSDAYDAVKNNDKIEEEVSKELLAEIVDRENRYIMNERRLSDKITFDSKPVSGTLELRLSSINYKMFLADSAQSVNMLNPSLQKILDLAILSNIVTKWRNDNQNDYLINDTEFIKDENGMVTGMKLNSAQSSSMYEIASIDLSKYPLITSISLTTSYISDSHKPNKYSKSIGFHWENGNITDFWITDQWSSKREEFDVQCNDAGKISKITDRELSKDPSGGVNNRAYTFECSGNQFSKILVGRISKSTFRIDFENIYSYQDNSIVQESTAYKEGKPLSDSKCKFISSKLGDRRYKFEESRPKPRGNTSTENIFDEKGYVLNNVFCWDDKKRITTNSFGEEESVLETIIEEYIKES